MTQPRRAVVTGGAGFIGSNLVRALLRRGTHVTVIDDLRSGHRRNIPPDVEFIERDFGHPDVLSHALTGADVVYHLAASSVIGESIRDQVSCFENNTMNTVRLIEGVRRHGVPRVVFASSASVYGHVSEEPVMENRVLEPLQPYGASKLAAEAALASSHHAYGIDVVAFRYFNVYGRYDEQIPATRAVPKWVTAALRNEALEVHWGGRQLRDYVFVDDLVAAHLAADKLQGFHVINLGSGTGIRMSDLAVAIKTIAGSVSVVKHAGDRPGDPESLVASIGAARSLLGWQPTTTMKDGLVLTIEHVRNEMMR